MSEPAPETATLPERPKKVKEPKKPKPPKQPKAPKPKNEQQGKPKSKAAAAFAHDPDSMFKVGFLSDVYEEKPVSDTVQKIVTRFPPEPNGFLHIGHSKAIAVNFGFARYHKGDCFLRFDDTNPQGEEAKYFIAIEEIVRWLGFSPVRITNASDNFDRLYELAEDLIQRDGAYVCHCTKAEIKAQRGESAEGTRGQARYACTHRSRPIDESLQEFRAMRDGKYKPGEAALRMKQDLEDPNPQMWDLFAYRILGEEESHHFRTGDKWKIYPTYDFAHCLCDSAEGITHSLCTTEFELSRVSYEWLCDKLEIYKPMQREYGRLNVSGTVLSKRKIVQLVKEGHVRDWDDPRLYTLIALRRRGIPPRAILNFVNELGVTKAKTNIQVTRLEQTVRRYLEVTVPRLMVVLEPLKVVIDELPDDHVEMVDLPFGKDESFGTHTVPLSKTVYIERSDFREEDSPDYFRLAPGKSVGLFRAPYPIIATSYDKDPETGAVICVHAKLEKPGEDGKIKRPKAFVHWVAEAPAQGSPLRAEVRVSNQLFKSDDPSAHPQGFLADINPDSEEIYPDAMVETGFKDIRASAPWPKEGGEKEQTGDSVRPETVRFQAMRVGYFTVDRETTDDKLILNRIVSLKSSA
ncbi:putative glutaminyl-tRNA synthetase [Eremomyces bilateralis CBS 781.70]|uniref:glutamine--tRNA ligase n=1 Tax=Eremomyces bilateralis CBS 781.70 TaxID=1392243 RepID=A0A6G1G4B4_9PEZI|nr:putative glutaminyl-tRNA synthetase [Eremomyces bilateralis CBS 781.70]KAF1812917.1 putative glutaminyl-tRNA synthetase [Eremomyces bilateralis CBS 781.70]